MKSVKIVILGQHDPIIYHLPVVDTFMISSTDMDYSLRDIYCIEVVGDETLLYIPGVVIEFGSASIGIKLLDAIHSGQQNYKGDNNDE